MFVWHSVLRISSAGYQWERAKLCVGTLALFIVCLESDPLLEKESTLAANNAPSKLDSRVCF